MLVTQQTSHFITTPSSINTQNLELHKPTSMDQPSTAATVTSIEVSKESATIKMAKLCAGCKQRLPTETYLRCKICKNNYDLECASVSKERFNFVMNVKQKLEWQCPDCQSKIPKIGNLNTPVRSRDQIETFQPVQNMESNSDSEINNVTQRRQRRAHVHNDSLASENLSSLGDTFHLEETATSELNLMNLSKLINSHLKENNKTIISELQNTIQAEITKAMTSLRNEMKIETSELFIQNDLRKEELRDINCKMEELKRENEKLQMEIKALEVKITSGNEANGGQHITESEKKKIVIYGLVEYFREPESHLHGRIVEMFGELLNTDLTGYIEDTYRVGRRTNKNRPLVVELISKRMVKYLLENNHRLRGTGISISEFLNKNAQKERKNMLEEMFLARKKGLHAVIRNKQLVIEGKLVSKKENNYDVRRDSSVKTLENVQPDTYENLQNNSKDNGNHTFRSE